MKIVILGPPGAGTSTMATKLSEILKLTHVSPGNLFNDNILRGTPIGIRAREIYNSGGMQSDDITNELIIGRLKEQDCKSGFILDGFPRNMNQAAALDRFTKIDHFIYVEIPEWLSVQRNTSRLTCEKCKKSYNPNGVRPKREGLCDSCGGMLIKRGDDNVESLKQRFRTMGPEILKPVADHYKEMGVFSLIYCDKPETTPEENLKKALDIIGK